VPSIGNRVSRWTPIIFACALANFIAAQALVVVGLGWPMASDASPVTLVDVHLVTVGWLTLLMFGALFQFVPVITARNLPTQHLSLGVLVLVELGLACMIGGFVLLGSRAAAFLLPIGGSLVLIGALGGGGNLLVPLVSKRPLPLSARFVLAGLLFLLLTIALGITFALALTVPGLGAALAPVVTGGVEYHALAGIGGWFTLTAIGVSYELLPMFMLASHDRGMWGKAVLWLGMIGFAIAFGAGVAIPFVTGAVLVVIEAVGRVAIALALVLYLIDVVRLYRSRRRRQIELHNRAVVGAFACLGLALVLAVVADVRGALAEVASPLVLLLLFGWLSGIGLSQLYKIVPFLAWLTRFGHRLGTGKIPRVQDLVNETAALPFFAVYFAAVVIAAVGAGLGLAAVVRGAMVLSLGATLLLTREYWRAWRGYYVRPGHEPATPSLPFGPQQKEAAHVRGNTPHA
jgi:hypothetical protein